MNRIFYNDWVQVRTQRIIDVLGKEWFAGKSVLELGACHGDIGMNLMRYGADVHFADIRKEYLDHIPIKYPYEKFHPKTIVLDQNKPYDLGKKFDLVVHMGTLYHVENWKQDLKCAMDHTSLMFLETVVDPHPGTPDSWYKTESNQYNNYNCLQPIFTQESVEQVLTDLGCKFIRIENKSMNTNWSWIEDTVLMRHVYDWIPSNTELYYDDSLKYQQNVHFRRMWLVIK